MEHSEGSNSGGGDLLFDVKKEITATLIS